jgi:hypothetical protein
LLGVRLARREEYARPVAKAFSYYLVREGMMWPGF